MTMSQDVQLATFFLQLSRQDPFSETYELQSNISMHLYKYTTVQPPLIDHPWPKCSNY